MQSDFARAFGVIVIAAGLCAPASAHGGAYAPTWGIPQGPSTPSNGRPIGPGPLSGAPGGGAKGPQTGAVQGLELTSWRDWWNFNQDAFLDLRRSIQQVTVSTQSDGPSGTMSALLALRVTPETVRTKLVPALSTVIDKERSNDLITGALLALARSGDPQPADAESSLVHILAARIGDPTQEVAESAALALGVLGDESALVVLDELLFDGEKGRARLGGKAVPARTRAFAAYALGLQAEQSRNNRTRQIVARALTRALEPEREATQDVQVACMIGLSLDRLDFDHGEAQSVCWVSRQSLLQFLTPIFEDGRRKSLVRAQAATTLARLVLDAPAPLREDVKRTLIAALRRERELENEVVQSCVQAVGLLADADGEALDQELRAMLVRALDDNDQQTRFFALIGLGEVGGRPGNGEHADEGRAECRNALLNELVRGRSRMRPWAALALGIQERRVREHSGKASELVQHELRSWLHAENSPDDIGAGAIALGLCRDDGAEALLRDKLHDASPTDVQGYLALSLGMIGAKAAIPELRSLVRGSQYRPWVLEPASIALALLGDHELQGELLSWMKSAQSQATQAALSRSLGFIGNAQAVDPLVELLKDSGATTAARAFAAIAVGRIAERSDLPWYVPIARDRNYRAAPPTLLGGDGLGILEIL